MTRIQPVFLAFAYLVGCGELSRTPGAADAGPEDAGSGLTRPACDECSDSPSARCFGGECVTRCTQETPFTCGTDFRCFENGCQRNVIATCEEERCNADQVCVGTYCVADSGQACDPGTAGACATNELCEPASGRCVVPPPCDQDLSCRPGESGAVCNTLQPDGAYLVTLVDQHRCLLGRCRTDAHCPAPLTCVEIGATYELLGVCR